MIVCVYFWANHIHLSSLKCLYYFWANGSHLSNHPDVTRSYPFFCSDYAVSWSCHIRTICLLNALQQLKITSIEQFNPSHDSMLCSSAILLDHCSVVAFFLFLFCDCNARSPPVRYLKGYYYMSLKFLPLIYWTIELPTDLGCVILF